MVFETGQIYRPTFYTHNKCPSCERWYLKSSGIRECFDCGKTLRTKPKAGKSRRIYNERIYKVNYI